MVLPEPASRWATVPPPAPLPMITTSKCAMVYSLQSQPSHLWSECSIAYRRPLASRMGNSEHPDHFAVDLVDQPVTLMRDQFARSGYLPAAAAHRKVAQGLRRIAEKLVQPRGGVRIVGRDEVPDIGAVLLRLRCPDDPHAWRATLARRAAKSASTSSLDRPRPARIEERDASTLVRKKAS